MVIVGCILELSQLLLSEGLGMKWNWVQGYWAIEKYVSSFSNLQGGMRTLGNENELIHTLDQTFDQQKQSIETAAAVETKSVSKVAEQPNGADVRSSTSSVSESDFSDNSTKMMKLRSSSADEPPSTGSVEKIVKEAPQAKTGTEEIDSVRDLAIETSQGGMVEDTTSYLL